MKVSGLEKSPRIETIVLVLFCLYMILTPQGSFWLYAGWLTLAALSIVLYFYLKRQKIQDISIQQDSLATRGPPGLVLALEASMDGIAILDKEERYVFVNKAHADIYGYDSPSEIIGKSWKSLYSADELELWKTVRMPQFMRDGKLRVEALGKKKDGSLFPQEVSLTSVSDGGLICVVRDITRRKNYEEDAREKALFAHLNPAPVVRFSAEGKILLANPAATVMLGIKDKVGSLIQEALPEITKSVNIEECIQRGRMTSFSTQIGARHFRFIVRGVPELKVCHLYGSDITDLKLTEEKLLDSKQFLRKVIDTDPNLIFAKDSRGRFTLVNQAVADVYGTTVDGLLGKTDADFNPKPEEVEHFLSDDKNVMESGTEKFIPEEVVTDANGNVRWLQTVKRPLALSEKDEVHVLGVSTDITERKKLEEQLLQSQKMEAIGLLAGGVAHDFNNLLTGIFGYTTLLKLQCKDHPDILRSAEMIEGAATKAAELTQQLLGFARKGKHQNVPVNLHNTIKETVALLSRTIEKNISISLNFDANEALATGDPVQLQQVILNLAINARDAMSKELGGSEGGELAIKSRDVTFPGDIQSDRLRLVPGRYIEIVVSDTGCGMDEDTIKRVFEPFFTTKDPSRGSGMGLAMVYGIVKNHAGGILVESEKGSGSKFSIYLPASPVSTVSKSNLRIEKVVDEPKHGKGRILVVDDHHVIRDVTSRMLSSLGYEVITARDGAEAIEYFKKHFEEIDLIIVDMVMPKMGAKECVPAFKKIDPDVKVILATGYDRGNSVQEILNEGSIGFVQKPFQLNKLSDVVAAALTGENGVTT